jgi:AraC-like DNA-binding protein
MASAPGPAASERLFVRLDDDPLYAPETSVPAGTLREFAVPRALAHAVAHLTAYEERLGAREEVRERVLPDGSMHLVFEMEDDAARLRVAGPSLRPAMLVMRGHVRGLSVKLKPGAALALFGTSAHEIAGRAVPWDELVGARLRGLPAQLQEAATDARRVALLTRTLHAMLDDFDGAALRKVVHAAGWLRGLAGLPIPEAAERVGVSERRLQQLFQAHVGLSPRAWRRLARIHDCMRLLRRGEALPWASVAAECGFSDQAHLGHEFRAICGLTPAQFLQRTGESIARHVHAAA